MKLDRKSLPSGRILASQRRSAGAADFEQRLLYILRDLARILVSSGYGVSELSRLAKRAYFEAATDLSVATGRRINRARIAAATGLSRAEVAHFSQGSERVGAGEHFIPVNRAQRVSWAWVTDPDYCSNNGRPNVLPYAGRKGSFEMLVKRYGGDIPVRAMLSEMLRLRMIKQPREKTVKLVRVVSHVSREAAASLRALSPWIGFLSQNNTSDNSELDATSVRIALSFESMPQLFAAVRQLQNHASAFVRSAHELGGARRRAKPYKLDVSVALGTRIFSPERMPKKKLSSAAI